jgi:hypothetical protein
MQASWRQRIRWGLLRSQSLPLVAAFYRRFGRLGSREVGRRLVRLPGVAAAYVRHSHPASSAFVLGHSDLDLTVVLRDEAAEDPQVVRRITAAIMGLRRYFFFVWPQDVRFTSSRELALYTAHPGAAEILGSPAAWRLIAGEDVRADASGRFRPDRVPWHPEFNSLWGNTFQSHLLMPKHGAEERFARTPYRVALKNQLRLQVARGDITPPAAGYIEDESVLAPSSLDTGLRELLAQLRRARFWAPNADEVNARIFRAILGGVSDFYRTWRCEPDAVARRVISRDVGGQQAADYTELRRRIAGTRDLIAILEAVVAYPTPHWHPNEHQCDLIIPDDLRLGDLVAAIGAIRQSFHGRTFALGSTHVQFTFVPKTVYQHPMYSLGTPFPFLNEHVGEFGVLLWGVPIRPARPLLAQTEMIDWCRTYFLWHMFNLRRRPDYSAKDCNFHQLGSLRFFLETGQVLTDALAIREAYRERFATTDRDRSALDLFLQRTNGPLDGTSYATAFAFLSEQYECIQSLLPPLT